MDLYLEVISGEAIGTRFKLAADLKVGRRDCDITINDPKISSHHANIVSRGNLKFFIEDNSSANGIKFNGLKVPELLLAPGVEFRLGNTNLKVIDIDPPLAKPSKKPEKESRPITPPEIETPRPPPSNFVPPEKFVPEIELPEEPEKTWRDVLLNLIHSAALRAQDVVNDQISAFHPPIKLTGHRGQELGKIWIFGYGPRKVGAKSVDLALKEVGAPPICFELLPHSSGVEFRTQFPKIVKLNGQERTHEILQTGDIIEILSTQLMVDFDES